MAALLLATFATTRAEIPEPDNLLYGNITLDNALVTAARNDVVIEARRTATGPAIARYRMGANPAAGNLYLLRLQLESVAPLKDPNSSQVADTLFIVVTDGSGLRAQTTHPIAERGVARRVDFGAAVLDSDGDGLPDAWELLHFAHLNQNANSPGGNGQTARQHYLAGTDPNDPDGGFKLHLTSSNAVKRVSFAARRAEGPGYEGLTRLYTLEANPSAGTLAWANVPGFVDVPGDNQTVLYQTAGAGAVEFFRGRVDLQPTGSLVLTNDTDNDGLPDDWEQFHFGNLAQNASSVGVNQQTAWQSYVAGNDPNDPNSRFQVSITRSNQFRLISFFSRSASGPGYAGRTRLYALETSPNLTPDFWTAVPGFNFLSGANQEVTYQTSTLAGPAFYRVRVWLQP